MGKVRPHMWKTFLAALAAVACLAAGTVPAPAETIVFGITSTTALSLPHYIADDKKFYDAESFLAEALAPGRPGWGPAR
jgi:ABC-type nitrate/sulfonate/bicarbonate transport system substrate-binding protein